MNFKCPYCFKEISDDEVLFRSEIVNTQTEDEYFEENPLPSPYDDIEDFEENYTKEDKQIHLEKYRQWERYRAKEDSVYEMFWKKYHGTTEKNPEDEKLGVKAYYRRIIDPRNPAGTDLKRQADGSFLIRDADGMVDRIEFQSGEISSRRVCPNCHNPLPAGYGKNPVRFVTVVGLAGAGKTVFLVQLLKNIGNYCAKVGLSAMPNSPSVEIFLNNNSIVQNVPLPASTPNQQFQQPLFFEIIRNEGEKRVTETLVLYDVAGEVFSDRTVDNFAPFVKHVDGVIVLIDPMQFAAVQGMEGSIQKEKPVTVLQSIHYQVLKGKQEEKCEIPFAVCISKADCSQMRTVLGPNIINMILTDVEGIPDQHGYNKPLFNVKGYRPIETELLRFFQQADPALTTFLRNSYAQYSFFALSSLGQESVMKQNEEGEEYMAPGGNVAAKRIEEPMLWLFYKFHYIGQYECPECGSIHNHELPEGTVIKEKISLFRSVEIAVDRECDDCGYQWNTQNTADTDTEEGT